VAGSAPEPTRRRRLAEVAALFTKLGVIGFGGPAAHIALMREEVVHRRQWIDDAEFVELIGATNLIPGPNSTELAIHLGARRAGWRGLLTAGVCFIGPAVIIVGFLAWLYEHHGTDPRVLDVRYGVLPVVVAIVGVALAGLARTAMTSVLLGVLALAAFALYFTDVPEVLVLVAAGVVAMAWHERHRWRGWRPSLAWLPAGSAAASSAPASRSLWRIFLVFLEIGSVLYGSGYVLLAFLQRELVDHRHWLTTHQLLDAVTVGQITPGPVFTTATFVGWQLHGPAGAAVATLGIFLPSFVFVALLGRIVAWVRRVPAARAFLTGVTAASLGLMAGVLVDLVDAALNDLLTVVAAVVAGAVLLRWRVNSAWLIVAAVALGAAHAALT
jgi:chromate transporter